MIIVNRRFVDRLIDRFLKIVEWMSRLIQLSVNIPIQIADFYGNSKTSVKHVFQNFDPFLANWVLKFQKVLI